MRKTDRKREAAIIRALTRVCEDAKPECEGFSWLTHEVDYNAFPHSLVVTLVFTEEVPEQVLVHELQQLVPRVQAALEPVLGTTLPPAQIEGRREHQVH